MNREVHARFWERAEVKFLRATRQTEPPTLSTAKNFAAGLVGKLTQFNCLVYRK